MQSVLAVVQNRATYLWALFLIPAASRFGHYLAPNQPILKGHDYGILVAALLTLVSAALWIPYQRHGTWSKSALLFFTVATVAWAYQVARIHLDNSLFRLTVFVLPAAMLLIGLKRASRRDTWVALWVLGYSLLAISLMSLVLGGLGLTPDGFAVSDSGVSRFQWLADIGVTRWGGPFGSVNYAAPIGGLLIVIGIAGGWRLGIPLIVGGTVVLALSQGRTALFATVAAVTVQILWSSRLAHVRNIGRIRISVIGALIIGAIGYVLAFDPTLAYRTNLWSDFSGVLDDSPIIGVGDSGIQAHVAEQAKVPGALLHNHLHSVLLDTYVRFGLVLVILGVLLYILALRTTIKSLAQIGATPLALVIFVITAGLTETTHAWAHWNVYLVSLTWAVMITAGQPPISIRSPSSQGSLSWARASS